MQALFEDWFINWFATELEARQHLEVEEERMNEEQKKLTVKGLAGVFSKVNATMLELMGMK